MLIETMISGVGLYDTEELKIFNNDDESLVALAIGDEKIVVSGRQLIKAISNAMNWKS